jgi:hypothetical protein
MQFPIGARAAGAKAVAEPDSDNEIAASLAVTQLQQGFTTGEMGLRGQVQGIISEPPMSLKGHSRPRQRTLPPAHFRFAPCVDGSELARAFFTSQGWSLQPCVRPLDAVHMTAGHNALRGSGPDRKPAFENASGRVGCPDRRIDRLCITCCSPSQPSHHVGCPTRSVTPQARRVPCNARP